MIKQRFRKFYAGTALLVVSLCGHPALSQDGYHFNGTVGTYEVSLVGEGFGSDKDVTSDLQALIDDVSARPEGGTVLLSGVVQLSRIYLKSNVHINIRKGTRITGTPGKGPAIFNLAFETWEPIENVKIFCGDCDRSVPVEDSTEKFIFDFSMYEIEEKVRAFILGDVTNFWISDFYVSDNQTKFSALTMNPVMKDLTNDNNIPKALRDWQVVGSPLKGDVRNAFTRNAHTGYGLVQVQCARDVYFEKISGVGGVTLRLESGASIQFVGTFNEREKGVIRGIRAKDVSLTDGFSTVTFSPHGRINEDVYLEEIRANSSALAVKIATGFFDRELMVEEGGDKVLIDPVKFRKGRFTGPIVIKEAHAVFGLNGTGRYGHEYLYVERSLREDYLWDNLPFAVEGNTKTRRIPSIATIGYKSIPHAEAVPDTVEGEYRAGIEGPVTSEGFPHCLDSIYGNIVYEDDKEMVNCSLCPPDTIGTFVPGAELGMIIYPNPASELIHIHHPLNSTILIFNNMGTLVRNFHTHLETTSTLDVSRLPRGIYILQIRNERGIINEKILIG